jgi:poly(A) polymerase/tRNA nucleotidyltransferase (CCA-adding enzyme)
MLADFWDYESERVNPAILVNGHDLMSEFDLPAGPQIGDLLEAVREAQADDQVRTREEAIALVRSLLDANHGNHQR